MSTAPINNPTAPDLRALLDGFKQEVLQSLNCHLFGTVQAVALEAGFMPRVSIQISSRKTLPNGDTAEYPLLTDCPVFVLGNGAAHIQMPIKVGDPCLVLFHDTDMDNWWVSGSTGVPNTARSHSLSDGMALIGFHNRAQTFVGSDPDAILIINENGKVTVQPTGEVRADNLAAGSYVYLHADGKIDIVATGQMRLITTGVNTIQLSNGILSLKQAMDELFTVLATWVNTGGSTPNPATLAAITAAKASVDAILA